MIFQIILAKFSITILDLNRIKRKMNRSYEILGNFTTYNKIRQYYTLILFNFCCISLIFPSAFDVFKSLLQNFGLIETDSQIGNFQLCNGEI